MILNIVYGLIILHKKNRFLCVYVYILLSLYCVFAIYIILYTYEVISKTFQEG